MGESTLDPVLTPEDKRVGDVIGAFAFEQVLRKIETGIRKPLGTGHPVFTHERNVPTGADHIAVVPDLAPEVGLVFDRPMPE